MSDVSRGDGWWQASDDRWYPPEEHPDLRPAPPVHQGDDVAGPAAEDDQAPVAKAEAAAPTRVRDQYAIGDAPLRGQPSTVGGGIRRGRALALVAVVVVVIVVVVFRAGGGHGTNFAGVVTGVSATDAHTLQVEVVAKNTGHNPGTPTCTVDVSSPGGQDTGTGHVTGTKALQPGQEGEYLTNLTITNGGAHNVQVSGAVVDCSDS